MLARIITRFKQMISRRVGPVMIAGFRSADGKWRPKSRYSSVTAFQGKEKIVMDDLVYIAPYCFIDGSQGLEIGEGCQICSWASLLTHSSHISIRLYGKQYGGSDMKGYVKGSVKIGKYSFIGPHAVIMPNTTIGKGCIVSSFAYVQGDFPDFSVISGNPARVVGDTRDKDKEWLDNNPELIPLYEEWAGKQMNFSKG
jgi:acetyltransferase-like isoleucine patch superfamily enzyme